MVENTFLPVPLTKAKSVTNEVSVEQLKNINPFLMNGLFYHCRVSTLIAILRRQHLALFPMETA